VNNGDSGDAAEGKNKRDTAYDDSEQVSSTIHIYRSVRQIEIRVKKIKPKSFFTVACGLQSSISRVANKNSLTSGLKLALYKRMPYSHCTHTQKRILIGCFR
jgi:mevalonate pyrophosphate decarboxylase